MIINITGNILQSDVEALVNTVNCVGIMGLFFYGWLLFMGSLYDDGDVGKI